ncbi:MAG: virulence factor [Pseudomonadota bacterium]
MKRIWVYWRDIPSQVIVQRGRTREKRMLGARFQEAIDRAAMRAGKGGSDEYIAEWRRESVQLDATESLQAIADREVEAMESRYSDEELQALIRAKGQSEPAVGGQSA